MRSKDSTTNFQNPWKEFTVTTAKEVVQYRDSRDQKVAKAGIQVRTGKKQRKLLMKQRQSYITRR